MKELTVLTDKSEEIYKQLSGCFKNNNSNLILEDNGQSVRVGITGENKPVIAHTIAAYIVKHYERRIIHKIINADYGYFNNNEKKDILSSAMRYIDEEKYEDTESPEQRLLIINQKLEEYLEGNEQIVLDGFVNFRLQEYISQLQPIVDKAVDEFLIKREYKEFIQLLKYFVELQPAREDVVHVVTDENSKHTLLNSEMDDITAESSDDLVASVIDYDVNYDDLLISALITLSPQKIIFHQINKINNKELLMTIKDVFGKKVVECKGCSLCDC